MGNRIFKNKHKPVSGVLVDNVDDQRDNIPCENGNEGLQDEEEKVSNELKQIKCQPNVLDECNSDGYSECEYEFPEESKSFHSSVPLKKRLRDPSEVDKLRRIYEQRPYEVEIVEKAIKNNSIVCVGGGVGKTFISVSVIKELQGGIRGTLKTNGKRTVLLVDSLSLAHQHADTIISTTCLVVGTYTADTIIINNWFAEQWNVEFDGKDILVMSGKILSHLLSSSILHMSNINLLVVDQCEQVTSSAHSYAQIFKFFDQCPLEKRPHILGLTGHIVGSVDMGHCKDARTFINVCMESLETLMHAKCVTCGDEMDDHAVRAHEDVKVYTTELSPHDHADIHAIADQEGEIMLSLNAASQKFESLCIQREENSKHLPTVFPVVSFEGCSLAAEATKLCADIICELGPMCGYEASKIFIKQLAKCKETYFDESNQDVLTECVEIFKCIKETYEECVKNSSYEKPRDVKPTVPFITNKALVLLIDVLLAEKNILQIREDNTVQQLKAIVFVPNRCTALVLSQLINQQSRLERELFDGVKSRHIVGRSSTGLVDRLITVNDERKVIKDFKSGLFSVLVSAGERLERLGRIQCNLVVMFNGLCSYSQYAEAKEYLTVSNISKITILSPCSALETRTRLKLMQEMESLFTEKCRSECIASTQKEIEQLIIEDEVVKDIPIYRAHEGPDAETLNPTTAVVLLHRFCSYLPSDQFSITTPRFEVTSRKSIEAPDEFCSTVYLPMNFPLEQKTYTSEWLSTKALCEKSLCFTICKILHKAGQLDRNLVPVRHLEVCNRKNEDDDELDEEKPKEGTRKSQDFYHRKYPAILSPPSSGEDNFDVAHCDLFVISMVLAEPRNRPSSIALQPLWSCDEKKGFGILLPPGVPRDLPPVKLSTRAGIMCIKFHYVENDNSVLDKSILSQFHMSMMDICATKHVLGKIIFNIDDSRVSRGLIVPLNSFVLAAVQGGKEVLPSNENAIDTKGMYNYVVNRGDIGRECDSGLVNAIINKTYLNEQQNRRLYYIASVSEEQGSDIMEGEVTYKMYYGTKYNHTIEDDAMLLEAVPCPSRVNFFEDAMKKDGKKHSTYKPERLIPALCRKAFRMHAHLHQQLNVFPYAYYCFESILNAEELRGRISGVLGISSHGKLGPSGNKAIDSCKPFETLLQELLKPSLVVDSSIPSPSIMEVLETLTTRQAKFPYDLERLEMLGDSFLKQAVTIYLYYKFPNAHEGILSSKRKQCISNKNLFHIAKILGLQHIICNSQFGNVNPNNENKNSVTVWLPPGCYREEEDVMEKLESSFPEVNDDDILQIAEKDIRNDVGSVAASLVKSVISESECEVYEEDRKISGGSCKVSSEVFSSTLDPVELAKNMSELKVQVDKNETERTGNTIAPRKQNIDIQISKDLPFQLVQDKTLADSVEALIGLYFKIGGTNLALDLMQKYLGIDVLYAAIEEKNICPVQTGTLSFYADFPKQHSAIQNSFSTYEDVMLLYERMELSRLEKILGYEFHDKSFIVQAMTHLSYTPNIVTGCYQQVEFLGDAILDFLITLHIYVKKPELSPGDLTSLRSALVNNNTFALLVIKYKFDRFLKHLSPTLQDSILEFLNITSNDTHTLDMCFENPFVIVPENSEEGYHAPKVLGDVFESIIGAVFLDSHLNLVKTWEVMYPLMEFIIEKYTDDIPLNPIREFYEKHVDGELTYHVVDETTVVCVAKYANSKTKTGMGKSRRIAKSAACYKALHT